MTTQDALLAVDSFIIVNTHNGVVNFDNVWFNMAHGVEMHAKMKGKSLDDWDGAKLRRVFEENLMARGGK